jgi:hypothetical protein
VVNNNMGKLGKTVKRIVWKNMWKRIAWEKCG